MTTTPRATLGSRHESPDAPKRPLFDPVTGRFNVARLLREIMIRGWTLEQFAADVTCGRTSVYKAVSGQPVRNRTALAIVEGLSLRDPRLPLLE